MTSNSKMYPFMFNFHIITRLHQLIGKILNKRPIVSFYFGKDSMKRPKRFAIEKAITSLHAHVQKLLYLHY